MIRTKILTLFLALAIGLTSTGAQALSDLLGRYRDWEAFTDKDKNGGKSCYIISVPKSSRASRKNVRRGDSYLMVAHRPDFGVTGEVSVVMGYPLKVGKDVDAVVDGKSRFKLFTEGDSAWAYDASDDGRIVRALRRGNSLVIKGTSTRGTDTTDSYSLSGFTAAINAITRACD